METRRLRIADIHVPARLRRTDPDWVAALLALMQERAGKGALIDGQAQPVEVAEIKGRLVLADGAHRLAALVEGGSAEAWVTVETMTEDERRLAEIDANLARNELTAFYRAAFLSARKEVYEKLHPEARRGVAGGKARQGQQPTSVSFAGVTAPRFRLGPDTITRLTSMFTRLSAASRDAIPGTAIEDSRRDLELLSRQGPADQARILKLVKGGKADTVADALAELQGRPADPDPVQRAAQRMLDGWHRAPAAARRGFIAAIPDDELAEAVAARGYALTRKGKGA